MMRADEAMLSAVIACDCSKDICMAFQVSCSSTASTGGIGQVVCLTWHDGCAGETLCDTATPKPEK